MAQTTWRALTDAEIAQLEQGGSCAEDWSRVRVREGFRPEHVAGCRFTGSVGLGAFRAPVGVAGAHLPSGVYRSHLHDATVDDDALVADVGLLSRYDVGRAACVSRTVELAVDEETSFGNGVEIEVLNEGGGREIVLFERLSAQFAYLMACYRHRPRLVEALHRMARDFAAQRRSDRGRVGAGAVVVGCGRVRNVAVGPAAILDGVARLENGTVASNEEAPTRVGTAVQAEDFIVQTGSEVDSGALLTQTFVGQGCRIGRQFSAEGCALFANCEGFHGEAISALAGPYSVTHHKSSILIAGVFSFYNAGSGTNQSNHMYKLGPVHQGVVERGSKTGSFSYLLWPARVGPFSAVLGKHYANFDARNLPFSYVNEEEGRSVLSPAVNLFTVGTRRDGEKWPGRDRRTDPDRLDWIRFEVFSPFTVGRMMAGLDEISALYERAERSQTYVTYKGIAIKRLLCRTAKKHYAMAIDLYLGGMLADRLERDAAPEAALAAPEIAHGPGAWVDVLGLLAPQSAVEEVCDEVESGRAGDLAALEARLSRIHEDYDEAAWAWACEAWRARAGKAPADMSPDELRAAVAEWRDAALKLNRMIRLDAEKEYSVQTRIGFGIDGDEAVRDRDFEAVRGVPETNKFIQGLDAEAREIRERAERLLAKLAS